MEVKLEVRPDHVLAMLTGSLSVPMFLQALPEILDLAANSGLHLILLDWSGVEGPITTGQRLEMGKFGAAQVLKRTWGKPPKIAIVGPTNLGVNARAFLDKQRALDWLGIAPRTDDDIFPGTQI